MADVEESSEADFLFPDLCKIRKSSCSTKAEGCMLAFAQGHGNLPSRAIASRPWIICYFARGPDVDLLVQAIYLFTLHPVTVHGEHLASSFFWESVTYPEQEIALTCSSPAKPRGTRVKGATASISWADRLAHFTEAACTRETHSRRKHVVCV